MQHSPKPQRAPGTNSTISWLLPTPVLLQTFVTSFSRILSWVWRNSAKSKITTVHTNNAGECFCLPSSYCFRVHMQFHSHCTQMFEYSIFIDACQPEVSTSKTREHACPTFKRSERNQPLRLLLEFFSKGKKELKSLFSLH